MTDPAPNVRANQFRPQTPTFVEVDINTGRDMNNAERPRGGRLRGLDFRANFNGRRLASIPNDIRSLVTRGLSLIPRPNFSMASAANMLSRVFTSPERVRVNNNPADVQSHYDPVIEETVFVNEADDADAVVIIRDRSGSETAERGSLTSTQDEPVQMPAKVNFGEYGRDVGDNIQTLANVFGYAYHDVPNDAIYAMTRSPTLLRQFEQLAANGVTIVFGTPDDDEVNRAPERTIYLDPAYKSSDEDLLDEDFHEIPESSKMKGFNLVRELSFEIAKHMEIRAAWEAPNMPPRDGFESIAEALFNSLLIQQEVLYVTDVDIGNYLNLDPDVDPAKRAETEAYFTDQIDNVFAIDPRDKADVISDITEFIRNEEALLDA